MPVTTVIVTCAFFCGVIPRTYFLTIIRVCSCRRISEVYKQQHQRLSHIGKTILLMKGCIQWSQKVFGHSKTGILY